MNCKETENYLPLYPDEVSPAIRKELENHLQQCPECRKLAENLRQYRSYAATAETPEVPVDFESRVMQSLEAEKRLANRRHFVWKAGLAVSSVAAILLIVFILFKPVNNPWDNAIEVSYIPKIEKKGKGSAPLADFQTIDARIKHLISETGASIEKSENNTLTGYYDYLILAVPGSTFSQFVEEFNHQSAIQIELPEPGIEKKGTVYIQLSFDLIRSTPGKFDKDPYADLLVQFISGRNKGKWMIYPNHDSSHFSRQHPAVIAGDESNYRGDFRMLSGDFNGDSLDDLCLYHFNLNMGLETHFLMNEGDFRFREDPGIFSNLTIPGNGESLAILSGDSDGDGRDDLLWLSEPEKGVFKLTVVNLDTSFSKLVLPDFERSGGVILTGDFNNDHYMDICVKYLKLYLRENTEIFHNTHDFAFEGPFFAGLSFQGDYIILSDDFDGDGFDDLLVKSGGQFLSGAWNIMRNNRQGKFIFWKQFELR